MQQQNGDIMVRIEINAQKSQDRTPERQEVFLTAVTMLRYLITDDEQLETAIICKQPGIDFTTTDQELYDTLACIRQYDPLKLPKLVKLIEVARVTCVSHKHVLTEEKLEDLRKEALIEKMDERMQ